MIQTSNSEGRETDKHPYIHNTFINNEEELLQVKKLDRLF